MSRILKGTGLSAAVALVVLNSIGTPASAITVELAKKCRDMAIKAHPPALPGAKKAAPKRNESFTGAAFRMAAMDLTTIRKRVRHLQRSKPISGTRSRFALHRYRHREKAETLETALFSLPN
jgi:hypothetical protein